MNTNAPHYKVLKVTDSNSYAPQTGAFRTKQVHYQLADGSRSYVELPHATFTPENVHAAIMQEADNHIGVMQLNPANPPQPNATIPDPYQ